MLLRVRNLLAAYDSGSMGYGWSAEDTLASSLYALEVQNEREARRRLRSKTLIGVPAEPTTVLATGGWL